MTHGFSAWKEGALHYIPALALACACLGLAARGHGAAWAGVVLFGAYGLFALFFFRDPPRACSAGPGEVLAPADGTVVGIEDLESSPHYEGPCRRVSIFLSVLDVHVNRAPCAGAVKVVRHKTGAFGNAMKAVSSDRNESNAVWLDTEHGPVTVRQIAGAVARRIVCVAGAGDRLERGAKFGMIKLGSRTELYLPPGTPVCATIQQKVRAGRTVVARFADATDTTE